MVLIGPRKILPRGITKHYREMSLLNMLTRIVVGRGEEGVGGGVGGFILYISNQTELYIYQSGKHFTPSSDRNRIMCISI